MRHAFIWNPRLAKARKIARTSHVTYRPPADVMNLQKDWRRQGKSYHSCAAKLNALGSARAILVRQQRPRRASRLIPSTLKSRAATDTRHNAQKA